MHIIKTQKAFTLLELLIVIIIILMMTLIAVPAFSKYGKEMAYKQKNSEIKTLIDQINISMLNPGKEVESYIISLDLSNKDVSLNRDPGSVVIKKAPLLRGQSLQQINNIKALKCYVATQSCDYIKNDNSISPISSSYLDFFNLYDSNVVKTATYRIALNPFRIEINE